MRIINSKITATLLGAAWLVTWGAACSTNIDDDGYRAGAIQLEIGVTTSDELYPDAGDNIDWKMIFVPTPGNLTVNTFWDSPKSIFGMSLGIYDRFGVLIKSEDKDAFEAKQSLTAFLPEPGLHYIKISATNGRSVYSIQTSFETNYDNFAQDVSAPVFSGYIDLNADKKKKEEAPAPEDTTAPLLQQSAPAAGSESQNGTASAPVLPTAVSGGVVSPGAQMDTPQVVENKPLPVFSSGSVKKVDNMGPVPKPADRKPLYKPIVSDIKKPKRTIKTDLMVVTKNGSGSRVKFSAGKGEGVKPGSVVDVYVNGSIDDDAIFKIVSVGAGSSMATSNAPISVIKHADKFVIKVP